MAWERLEIRNFQSLREVDLALGNFTVIVGHTGSGKSALVRSIKALTSNVRGAGSISVGASKVSVSATVDGRKVTLERGVNSGSYRITEDKNENVFTKLAGQVPEQVSKALRFDPVLANQASTNFAGQHDSPFLLDDSGAAVARTLGELTSVSKIFDAVREANRRRQNVTSTLNTRKKDLTETISKISAFKGIEKRISILAKAEETFKAVEEKAVVLADLEVLIIRLENAVGIIDSYKALPLTPDLSSLIESYEELRSFSHLLVELNKARDLKVSLAKNIEDKERELRIAEEEFNDALRSAGACPLCGK